MPDSHSNEEPVSEFDLMAAVTAKDKNAFSLLYDRYAPAVMALCLRILHSESEAEATVSDVFLEIWRKPERFNPLRGSCSSYLFALARSRAIDRLRATNVRIRKMQTFGELQQQTTHEPTDELLAGERQQFVREALAKIDHEQRQALTLAYFEGMTHGEISTRLERPLGTVKTHIRRGLQSLKAALKNRGGRDGLS